MINTEGHELQESRLGENIVHFARALRNAGLSIGPAQIVDAVKAIGYTGVRHQDDFYWALHGVMVKKHEQSIVFSQVFLLFWKPRGLVEKLIALLSPIAVPREKQKPKPGAARAANALMGNDPKTSQSTQQEIEVDARFTVSGREVLQNKDFAQMSAEEIAEARLQIRRLILPDNKILTRRMKPSKRGHIIDTRKTLRSMLRTGGDMIIPHYRDRAPKNPPIVALLDISGSMSDYSRMFLQFLHALSEVRRPVHSFVFGTRLTNITRQLTRRDPDEALDLASREVEDWSGGTRIAASLASFNKLWSRRVMTGGPVVLLISDGLERSGDDDPAPAIERLQKSCRKLIWLNPLLRFDGFEPKAKGIRQMLPFVDEFRAIHNLKSMAELCTALSHKPGSSNFIRQKGWKLS
ncbi:MAG: VWA domain-containing protein [Hyphomicrobiales bacterium]|nr:MAG: VWA domain-containing protein [Hyphomicrobiales bacterium]